MKSKELPKEWEWKQLGDVANFVRGPFGSSVKKSVCIKKGKDTYKVYEQGNVINNDFKRGEYYITKEQFYDLEKFEVLPGDILFTCAGTLGKIAIVPDKIDNGIINSVLMRVRINKKMIDDKYFLNYFRSSFIQNYISYRTYGATIKNLFETKLLRTLLIPLPPLSTQRKIVAILEKAEQNLRLQEEAECLTDELAKSVFLEMFGDQRKHKKNWEIKELREVTEEFRYGTSNKSSVNGNPILGIPNILGDKIDISKINRVQVSEAEFNRLKLINGDVLFVRTNGNPDYIGRCGVFDIIGENYIFASYLIRCRLKKELNPIFLKAYLDSSYGRMLLKSKCKTTAGQYNINTEGLGGLKIIIPPIDIQNKFVQIINKYQGIIIKSIEIKKQETTLFNSLMQKAFTGELVS